MNYIQVEGTGQVEVPIEYISLHFSVTSTNKSPLFATNTAKRLLDTVFNALRIEHNIEDNDIYTEYTSLDPQYKYEKNDRILIGFESRTSVHLKIREPSAYTSIITTLVSKGVEETGPIEYVASQNSLYYHQALELAYDQALHKAEVLFEKMGVSMADYTIQVVEHSAPSQISLRNAAAYEKVTDENFGLATTTTRRATLTIMFLFK